MVTIGMSINYCQCKLKKGNTEDVVWIPEKYAKEGKWLKIAGDNGWEVLKAGTPMPEEYVFGRERDFTKQRDASDI